MPVTIVKINKKKTTGLDMRKKTKSAGETEFQLLEKHAQEPTWTISNISQRVPLPLRKTSSGDMGIIVAREKIKGWT